MVTTELNGFGSRPWRPVDAVDDDHVNFITMNVFTITFTIP